MADGMRHEVIKKSGKIAISGGLKMKLSLKKAGTLCIYTLKESNPAYVITK